MPRLQDLFSRIPERFSGARLRSMQQADNSHAQQAQSAEDVDADADADTPVDRGDTVQAQRQEISAFMPLSRWIAKVQTPGSGKYDD